MKRYALYTLMAGLLIGLASPVSAQVPRPFKFGVNAGISVPTSDLSDGVKTGFVANANLSFKPWLVPLGVQVEGGWNQWGFKDEIEDGGGVVDDGNIRVLNVSANLTYDIPSVVIKPYLIGGLGWYRVTGSLGLDDATLSSSTNKLGFGVGAGIRIPMLVTEGVAEIRYHRVKASENMTLQYIPITVGIRF